MLVDPVAWQIVTATDVGVGVGLPLVSVGVGVGEVEVGVGVGDVDVGVGDGDVAGEVHPAFQMVCPSEVQL